MTQELQSSLPSPIQEKELPAPQEPLLSAAQESSPTDKLMEIINKLSGEDKKQEILGQYHLESKQKEDDLKQENYTSFTNRFLIDEKINELRSLKNTLFSKTILPGMTQGESEVYRKEITKELLGILGLDENTSVSALNQEMGNKLANPLMSESEELHKNEEAIKNSTEEMAKTKIIDALDVGKIDAVVHVLGRTIEGSIESQKMNKDEMEHTFMDNCLAIFTTNPQNLELMSETINNHGKTLLHQAGNNELGEKFFLDTVKDHLYQKIADKFPENYKERVKQTVSDKVDFNYGQYKLQQFISKNPEIGNLIDKTKWLEYYSQSEGRTKETLERLKIQLSESKIDLNSNIQVGKRQIAPHKDNAIFYDLTLEESKNNLQQAEVDIKNNQAQIISLQNELLAVPKPGFFNREKIEQQKIQLSQKIEELKKSIGDDQNKRMEISANQHHIFREISQIEECITRVGFNLEQDSNLTVAEFISKIENFVNNPKLTEEERKMAKKYVQIRLPMDQIANKYFFHREYSYWTGDEQGENNILGWEHIGK